MIKGGVTWFLTLAPPKSTPTPSFYVTWKVWLIFVHWYPLYLYIHLPFMFCKKLLKRNCKKRHPLMFISQSLSLAPSNLLRHEGCWAHGLGFGPHLGLGFLGLGLHVKNTNRKNFKCFGPRPFLLLMASLFPCWDDPSTLASLVIFMCFWVTSPGLSSFFAMIVVRISALNKRGWIVFTRFSQSLEVEWKALKNHPIDFLFNLIKFPF